jgi:hypothetical protein
MSLMAPLKWCSMSRAKTARRRGCPRDVEEALDLRGVEVERQDAVHAGGGQEVRHELGADGRAGLGAAVLPA